MPRRVDVCFRQFSTDEVVAFFFTEMKGIATAYGVFVDRAVEVLAKDPAAWSAFRRKTGIAEKDVTPRAVGLGLTKTVLNKPYMVHYGRYPVSLRSPTDCSPKGAGSFFNAHGAWFRPVALHAFRDSDVVQFQVRYWETYFLEKGRRSAVGLNLPEAGAILLTFVWSHPGQFGNPPRNTLMSGVAPQSISIGGKAWSWSAADRPEAARNASVDNWRLLLIWDSMCAGRDRIRNRNIAFFGEYLGETFAIPAPRSTSPSKNCNPSDIRAAASR